jgi:hypothetical protein
MGDYLLAGSGKFVNKSPTVQDFLRHPIPIHLSFTSTAQARPLSCERFSKLTFSNAQASTSEVSDRIKKNLAIAKDVRFETKFRKKYPILSICGFL